MHLHEAQHAIGEAKRTLESADKVAAQMAEILIGRLRAASKGYWGARACAALKRELREFNIQTHKWKS